GEPGTPVRVQWGAAGNQFVSDGEYAGPTQSLVFRAPSSGEFLVGVHDVPSDRDAPPLSCQLLHEVERQPTLIEARDFLQVSPRRPFDRAFNYTGGEATLWLDATEWGYYTFAAS